MLTRIYFLLTAAMLAVGCSAVPNGSRAAAGLHAGPHREWERREGGVVASGAACERASAALQQVAGDLPVERVHVPLAVHVLDAGTPAAFSFPDGSVYVTRGLVAALTDDELAAAVAHELGHLLHAGVIEAPAMLRGSSGGSGDVEQTADLLGRQLLIAHHVPASALTRALAKVAALSQGTPYCGALEVRVRYLHAMDLSDGQ